MRSTSHLHEYTRTATVPAYELAASLLPPLLDRRRSSARASAYRTRTMTAGRSLLVLLAMGCARSAGPVAPRRLPSASRQRRLRTDRPDAGARWPSAARGARRRRDRESGGALDRVQ